MWSVIYPKNRKRLEIKHELIYDERISENQLNLTDHMQKFPFSFK